METCRDGLSSSILITFCSQAGVVGKFRDQTDGVETGLNKQCDLRRVVKWGWSAGAGHMRPTYKGLPTWGNLPAQPVS